MATQYEPFTIQKILKWADQHKQWVGRWPTSRCGPILGQQGLTWEAVNTALRKGGRGLPGGTTLAQLLAKRRGAIDARRLRPDMTAEQILEWARLHHLRYGRWPDRESGRVLAAPDITWSTVGRTLRRGGSNLRGGMSLLRFLRKHFGVWSSRGNRRLSIPLILKWADEHYARTGRWPIVMSGKVHRHPQETWAAINEALRHGRRGLPGNMSLAQVLAKHRGAAYDPTLATLTPRQILAWADEHYRRQKCYPTAKSGRVPQARITWATIDRRLRHGGQGLPGGSSLAALLATRRNGVKPKRA